MDNCRISSGKVAEVIGTNLIVATTTLAERDGKIIEEESTKTIAYLPELMPDVKKGDVVAIHWGFAPLVLTAKQEKNLRKYSGIVLRVYTEKCS